MILDDKNFDKFNLYNRKVLRKDIYSNEKTNGFSSCPYCKSKRFIKFGKYSGIQRYRCKSCGKTFSNTTNSLWKYLKHSPEKWIKFIEFVGEKRTLEYCAKNLDISIVTAFNWRHKVLHGIENLYIPKELNNLIFMELYCCRRNYKGSKNKHFEFANDFYKRYNIAPRDVYTVISYDVNDSMLIRTVGLKRFWKNCCEEEWEENFEKDVHSLCDEKSYIHINPLSDKPLHSIVVEHNKKLSYKIKRAYNFDKKSYYVMDNIKCVGKANKIAVRLNSWIGEFRGVATKYLNHYCSLFALVFVDKVFDYMKIFFDLVSECKYTSVNTLKLGHVEYY